MSETISFTSDITVELVSVNASDRFVVDSARVSTTGERGESNDITTKDVGLIRYLMENRHMSPFEHGMFMFYVEAPIFVWREHMRHRTMHYNETSGRYKELTGKFYIPNSERNLKQVGKPGAYEFVPGSDIDHLETNRALIESAKYAYEQYQELLDRGIAREVARMCLPVNIYSSAYVTTDPRSLMHFISLRTFDEDASIPSYPQYEIEQVARQYETHLAEHMPETYWSFVQHGRTV